MGWHLNLNAHMQITIAVALKVLYPFAFDPEGSTGLCAGGNLNHRLAVQRGYLDFRAEGRLNKADRSLAEQIITVALEKFVRFDVQNDVQITRGPAAEAGFAVAGRAQAGSGVHARRDSQFDFRILFMPALTVTRFARFLQKPARAFAMRAGLPETDKTA